MFVEANSLCLKQEFITTFHDNINTASHVVMEQHIPYSHHPKAKVIPGWDIEMDIARNKSMFWYGIWRNCGRLQSGVVYSIMKKTRSTYHYMLRSLKKKKHSKTLLRIKNRNYWKTARVERKNKFNCTNVVDGVKGDSEIANLFKDKYERLFNSVKDVESEAELLKRNIHSEAETICNKSETCRETKCVHCHIISSTDVSIAIKKN